MTGAQIEEALNDILKVYNTVGKTFIPKNSKEALAENWALKVEGIAMESASHYPFPEREEDHKRVISFKRALAILDASEEAFIDQFIRKRDAIFWDKLLGINRNWKVWGEALGIITAAGALAASQVKVEPLMERLFNWWNKVGDASYEAIWWSRRKLDYMLSDFSYEEWVNSLSIPERLEVTIQAGKEGLGYLDKYGLTVANLLYQALFVCIDAKAALRMNKTAMLIKHTTEQLLRDKAFPSAKRGAKRFRRRRPHR